MADLLRSLSQLSLLPLSLTLTMRLLLKLAMRLLLRLTLPKMRLAFMLSSAFWALRDPSPE